MVSVFICVWGQDEADIFGCVLVVAYECLGIIIYRILAEYGDLIFKLGMIRINVLECFRFIIGPLIFAFLLGTIIMRDNVKNRIARMKWLQKLERCHIHSI